MLKSHPSFSRTSYYLFPPHQSVRPHIGVRIRRAIHRLHTLHFPVPPLYWYFFKYVAWNLIRRDERLAPCRASCRLQYVSPVWQPTQADLTMNAVYSYMCVFFLSKCVSASPLPRISSKEKKNVPFADATSGTGLWRRGWRWAQPVAGVTRGKWRGCLGRPFPRVGARSFHRESLDPRGQRSRPMWGCVSPWDGAGKKSSPVSPTSAFRREWNPVYPWYDGQYVLRTTPPPIPLPHF